MKKPRKPYKPKQVHPGGGLVALAKIGARAEASSPLRDDQKTDLGTAYWLSIDNLLFGSADEEHWSCVACALNIGLALSETIIGQEHEQDFVKALEGLFRAKVRSQRVGNFRLDGEAMRDVKYALEVHDEQVKLVTRAELVAAMQLVRQRVEEGNVFTIEAA